MREAFIDINFKPKSLEMIATCNAIIDQYQAEGYQLTLRQLYYQLVSANLVPNTERSYKNTGSLMSKGRMAGLVDWDAIEDRTREPEMHSEWVSPESLMEGAIAGYRLPRWQDQPYYAELWVEKDALAGVLEPVSERYHVTLMVNRGYSSQSAMYQSMGRFMDALDNGQELKLFYLGDLDPSGEDMVRDIRDRLALMGVDVDVVKLAITLDQVTEYNPPPNPAKMSDSRARGFVEQFGYDSYEVDALRPNVLVEVIEDALDEIVDRDKMDAWLAREEQDKELIRDAAREVMQLRMEDADEGP